MKSNERKIGNAGIAAIMLMSSLTVMVGNAITPALPELGEVFGLGNFASWLVTAPALGVVVTSMFFGQFLSAMLVSFISGRSLFITASIMAIVIGACILSVQKHFSR